MKEITVNGVEYIEKSAVEGLAKAEKLDGMEYCIVRYGDGDGYGS